MNNQDPFSFDLVITYVWVIGLAMLGGVANFARRVRDGKTRGTNLVEFTGELVISAFAGMVTFYLCRAAALDEMLTAAFIGVSGHMGSRLIFKAEMLLERRLGLDNKRDNL